MGDRIFVRIQKNFDAGPTMVLLAPTSHSTATTGYDLHFSGMEFTVNLQSRSLTVVGDNVLKKSERVWVANSGGQLPTGLLPRTDYYVSDLEGQEVRLALDRVLSAPAELKDAGTGTHFFLTWPDAPPFRKLMNQSYRPRTVEEAGTMLAEALRFHPAIQAAFGYYVQPSQVKPVPIYIEVGPGEAEALPWEALYSGPLGFLALDPRWPIARSLSRGSVEVGYAPPIKIMAVLSAPTPADSAEPEWDAIYSELKVTSLNYELLVLVSETSLEGKINSLNDPQVTVMALTSEDEILQGIKDFQPDLLHFYCHGLAEGPAQLMIYAAFDVENELDPSIAIAAEKLWQNASAASPPWLLILNCCESAAPGSGDTLSIACQLVKTTFPSVIGMRLRVASDYANHFSRFLYRGIFGELSNAVLSDTYEIEWPTVLCKARQELAAKFAGTSHTYASVASFCNEWTVPVLYTVHDPLKLRKLARADERVKARRQALVRIRAIFQGRGDDVSLKIAERLGKKITDIDAELHARTGA
jgi:hypothetical protein